MTQQEVAMTTGHYTCNSGSINYNGTENFKRHNIWTQYCQNYSFIMLEELFNKIRRGQKWGREEGTRGSKVSRGYWNRMLELLLKDWVPTQVPRVEGLHAQCVKLEYGHHASVHFATLPLCNLLPLGVPPPLFNRTVSLVIRQPAC